MCRWKYEMGIGGNVQADRRERLKAIKMGSDAGRMVDVVV